MVVLPNLGSRSRGINSLWLIRRGRSNIGNEYANPVTLCDIFENLNG
ncbi:hypothetical protein AB0H49_09645 [Nocardia sp. NPDC050713]